MNPLDDAGRGDRLWLQPAKGKVARPMATIQDVILGGDGRPACLVARIRHEDGRVEPIILTLERPGHGG